MTQRKKLPKIIREKTPWSKNGNHIWLASTITLLRNIDKFPFPSKMNESQRTQIVELINKEFLSTKTLSKAYLLKAEEMTNYEKEYLVEHFLSNQSFHQAESGEGFILDATAKLLISLNLNNHIQLRLLEFGGELEEAWNRLVKVESALGKKVNFSFSQKFGFLTAEPYTCGTGLLVSAFLQPSALIHTHQIEEVLKRCASDALTITGLQGDPQEIIGDILAVRNTYTLGVTDENIISKLRTFTTKLMVEENSARKSLREEENGEVKDRVSRAYAILTHSYKIDAIEALDALSLLKLGADLGWVEGIAPTTLNELFFDCRRAHLLCHHEEDLPQEKISHFRAEFIHKALQNVTLKI